MQKASDALQEEEEEEEVEQVLRRVTGQASCLRTSQDKLQAIQIWRTQVGSTQFPMPPA